MQCRMTEYSPSSISQFTTSSRVLWSGYVKLLRIVGTFLLCSIRPPRCGSRRLSGIHPAGKQPFHCTASTLSCGDYHAGVRYGNSDAGDDLFKKLIAQCRCQRRSGSISSACLILRYADGVRTYSVYGFKMLCVHQQPCKFISDTSQGRIKRRDPHRRCHPPLLCPWPPYDSHSRA